MQPSAERGLTLVELLVAILIVGVLAAIAIPLLLSQTHSAGDASAESAVTNLRKAASYCELETHDYTKCSTAAEVPQTGLTWGSSPGTVAVAYQPYGLTDDVAFEAIAQDGTTFAIVKSLSQETVSRVCVTAKGQYPLNSCKSGGSLDGYPVGQW